MHHHSIHTLAAILTRFFPLHKTRLETMAAIIIGLCLSRTVNLGFLAQHFCNAALPASNYRRLQRFFQAIRIAPATLARLLIRIARLRPPWHLALDRTDWRFGNTPINLQVLAIVTRRVRLPILFIVLKKAGSSSADECIRLMQAYLAIFPASSVRALLADREFGMGKLLEFLDQNNIPFIIRLKENRYLQPTDQPGAWRLKTLLRHHRAGRVVRLQGHLHGVDTRLLRIQAKRRGDDLMIVVTNIDHPHALRQYRKRWGIECLFAHLKRRGFNTEDTHLRCPHKLHAVLALVAIATAWAQACARQVQGRKAIPRKKHRYPATSWFRLGSACSPNMAPHQSTPTMEGLEDHPPALPGKACRSRKGNMSRVVRSSIQRESQQTEITQL